jgi:hypothetical protein
MSESRAAAAVADSARGRRDGHARSRADDRRVYLWYGPSETAPVIAFVPSSSTSYSARNGRAIASPTIPASNPTIAEADNRCVRTLAPPQRLDNACTFASGVR